MLEELGIEFFASNAREFLQVASSVRIRTRSEEPYDVDPPSNPSGEFEPRQLLLAESVDADPIKVARQQSSLDSLPELPYLLS
jgi:hypothetical protein